IYEHGAAFDLVELDESPEAAVVTAVAVVTHHEELTGRHRGRRIIVTHRELRALARRDLEVRMRIGHRRTIEEHLAVLHLHGIAGDSNDALDEVLGRVERKNEHHHVAAADRRKMHQVVAVRNLARKRGEAEKRVRHPQPVADLVDHDMVADRERRLHRARRYLVGLDEKSAQNDREDEGDDDRFGPLAKFRAMSFDGLGRAQWWLRVAWAGLADITDGRSHGEGLLADFEQG